MSGKKREAEDVLSVEQPGREQEQQHQHEEAQNQRTDKAEGPSIKRVKLDEGLGQPSSPVSEGIDIAPSSPTSSLLKSKNERKTGGQRSGRGGGRGVSRGGRGGDKKNRRDWNDGKKGSREGDNSRTQAGDEVERDEDAGQRIPKKKVAMLIGYSGLGYSGSQMYVPVYPEYVLHPI